MNHGLLTVGQQSINSDASRTVSVKLKKKHLILSDHRKYGEWKVEE